MKRMTEFKRRREAAGLNLRETADRAGLTDGMIWFYDHGLRQPRWEMAQRLAEILGTSVRELWPGLGPPYILIPVSFRRVEFPGGLR